MDYQKDIQRTDSATRILDDHFVRTNPFGANKGAERVYRRVERIAAALHLLTNHINPEESLRSSIRVCAAQMLSVGVQMRDEMRSPESSAFLELQSRIRYAISLVRLATVSGFISLTNGTAIVEALDELGVFLTLAQKSPISEHISFSKEDLEDVGRKGALSRAGQAVKDRSTRSTIKDKGNVSDSTIMSDNSAVMSENVHVRVQNILAVLKGGGSFGIKDVVAQLPEYSEKMVQRALVDLVERGQVTKTGLKRWSRYSAVA